MFKHIAIVGLGLIGGSFAKAVRRAQAAERITAWDTGDVLEKAIAAGAIDAVEDAFETRRDCEADLIYLATPVGAIINFLRQHGAAVKPGAIVTDAGSTKREICRAAQEGLSEKVDFIGGHPMAGSHQRGFDFARDDLFRGAPYALISSDEVDAADALQTDAISRLQRLVEAIGGRPVLLTAERHDHAVARISHAPQLIATALATTAAASRSTDAVALVGSGFVDMTRLAASHWSVWEDIISTNSDEIIGALKEFEDWLGATSKAMATHDLAVMESMFRDANDFIRRVNEKKALNV